MLRPLTTATTRVAHLFAHLFAHLLRPCFALCSAHYILASVQNPGPCIEGEMDTQYITAMASGAPTTYYAYSESASYPDYIKAVSNDKACALVHSMSYGWNEYVLFWRYRPRIGS